FNLSLTLALMRGLELRQFFFSIHFNPFWGELAPVFWASMVPSIWLWLYVAATLIVRLAVRTTPAFHFSMYLFDVDQHPIRSVGVVAAALVSGAYAMLLAISKFAHVLSEGT